MDILLTTLMTATACGALSLAVGTRVKLERRYDMKMRILYVTRGLLASALLSVLLACGPARSEARPSDIGETGKPGLYGSPAYIATGEAMGKRADPDGRPGMCAKERMKADGIVRLSRIEVYPRFLDEYVKYVTEVGEVSLRTEPGVLTMYAVSAKDNPCEITILETYASQEAYGKHIASRHFRKYKQGTLHMVKSLELEDQTPLNPANRLETSWDEEVATRGKQAAEPAGGETTPTRQNASDNQTKTNMENKTIKLTLEGGKTFTVTLADNSSANALRELLDAGDVTVRMEDYGNMEKVGPLGKSLPRNDKPTTTGPGDLILYQGKYLVIYYATNSWNFTRLGKIDKVSADELRSALGKGDVTVTLSIAGE